VNFLISMTILLVIVVIVRIPLSMSLGLLPVIVIAQLGFTIGIVMLLATLTVYFRDLEHLVGIGLTALFYLSPVLYPLDPHSLPRGAAEFIPFLRFNPLAWYFDTYHAVMFYGTWPSLIEFGLMLTSSAVSIAAGYLVLHRLRARLPEEV
jgi:lipopolysaccharide transport system permease protein